MVEFLNAFWIGKVLLGKPNRQEKKDRCNFTELLSTKILKRLKRSRRIKILAICLTDKRSIGRM